jgi:hypothetical protein
MARVALVAAVACLALANTDLVHAQAAIQEPGAYAFYHPDGDVLRAGPQYGPRPETYRPIGTASAMLPPPAIGRRVHRRGWDSRQ